MSWLAFIASLVNSLAWPALVLIVVLVLRAPIATLIKQGGLRRAKLGPTGVEVEWWDRQIESAQEVLELEPHPTDDSMPTELATASFEEEMSKLARLSPRAAILESFFRLEQLLRQAIRDEGVQVARWDSRSRLVEQALHLQLLTEREAGVFDDMATLRNAIAHSPDPEVDYDRAMRFVGLTIQIAINLRLIRGETNPDGPLL